MALKKRLDAITLAYVAGIVDGEGCIRIDKAKGRTSKRGYCYVLVLTVSNTNEWLCQHLKNLFGGCTFACYHQKPRKVCWEWRVAALKARAVLEQIAPYLTIKKPQAELALQFQKRRRHRGGRIGMTEAELAVDEAEFIIMKALKTGGG